MRVERNARETVVLDAQCDSYDVPARRAPGAADNGALRDAATAPRIAQVLLEGMHPSESKEGRRYRGW